MDTHKLLFMLKTHFNSLDRGFLSEFLYRVMFRFGNSIWIFFSTFFFNLYELIKYISQSQSDDENDSNCRAIDFQEDDQIVSNNSMESDSSSMFWEQETSQLSFGFRFQTGRDSSAEETESSVFREKSDLSMSTSMYQFISGKDVGGFIEEPKTMSFTVQELFACSNEGFIKNDENLDTRIIADNDFEEQLYQDSNHSSRVNDQFVDSKVSRTKDLQQLVLDVDSANKQETEDPVKSEEIEDIFSEKITLSCGAQFLPFHSNSESSPSSGEFSINTQKIFPSDWSINEELESENLMSIDENKVEFIDKILRFEESRKVLSSDKLEESDDEYIELEPNLQNSSEGLPELGKNIHSDETELMDGLGKSEEESLEKKQKPWDLGFDEEEGNDILFEHEDLIEQMKIELKNVRTGGLPTILEDSETPKMVGDLKPLKIDEKFEHRDRMVEIQKFYKSYAEKMRKLDISNYQTMHAISFLQLKDPIQLGLSQKSSVSALKSLLLPNSWPCKLRKIYADPTLKSINELQRDLEVVYVGQVCLSWEILHWQHRKAKELSEYDSQGYHSYNHVAGEFQQFQVLVQRFTEDEKFKGPRIKNYCKNRGLVRSFLQVPTVKDDCLKDKKGRKEDEEDYAISIALLADISEESMRVFWEFIRADKDATNTSLNGLQDSADSELLMDIKTSLQKKEKRLKDIMRSGNCLVKKFQKQEGRGRLLHYEMLVSQVELRLISMVLNMSKLSTDQLVWCQTKLNNINFVNRKIYVEPSFLLFPC
ncbi:hypothetical protein LguiB_024915 [Lonicera macranthoides]